MACKSCGSDNQSEFGAEINIHFPGRKGLDKPAVLVFPKLVVCLDCGFTHLTLFWSVAARSTLNECYGDVSPTAPGPHSPSVITRLCHTAAVIVVTSNPSRRHIQTLPMSEKVVW